MEWFLLSQLAPVNEDEVLTFCKGDGISGPFYNVDAWHNGRGEFMEAHCNGFEVIAWARIEEPPRDILNRKAAA